jgi:VWFA-related protein
VYGVAVVDPIDTTARPDRLEQLARSTGGVVFKPRTRKDISAALGAIARDIRQTYTIGYVPSRPPDGTYRQIRVVVTPPPGQRLNVRTRAGYVAVPLPMDRP